MVGGRREVGREESDGKSVRGAKGVRMRGERGSVGCGVMLGCSLW